MANLALRPLHSYKVEPPQAEEAHQVSCLLFFTTSLSDRPSGSHYSFTAFFS